MLIPGLNWITGEGLTNWPKWKDDGRRSREGGYMTVSVSSGGFLSTINELMDRTVNDTCRMFDIENKKTG